MKTGKILLVIALVAMLVVGVSAVGAQNGPGRQGYPGGPGGGGMGFPGRPGDGRGGFGRPGMMGGFGNLLWHPLSQVLDIVEDETGLGHTDIIDQMRDGSSLADIITANGGDVDAVIAASVTAITDDINQAVADGKLSQEQADRLLTNLDDLVTDGINGEFPQPLQQGVRLRIGREVLALAADQTGLEAQDILQQLRAGTTLGQVLTNNNVDVDSFVDAVVEQATTRFNQAVENGRITQERADELIQTFRDQLTEQINQTIDFGVNV